MWAILIIEKEFYKYLDVAQKDLLKIEKIQKKTYTNKINRKNDNVIDELEKIDISEEIDRINSHLNQILCLLYTSPSPRD